MAGKGVQEMEGVEGGKGAVCGPGMHAGGRQAGSRMEKVVCVHAGRLGGMANIHPRRRRAGAVQRPRAERGRWRLAAGGRRCLEAQVVYGPGRQWWVTGERQEEEARCGA